MLKPPAKKPFCEHTLFNYETTHRTDYREGAISEVIKTPCREKPPRQRKPYKNVKYLDTMLDWKKILPFDALWKPKEILQTHPNTPQQVYAKIEDLDRDKVRRTRPRLVIAPAISIDDMDDEKRDVVIESTYTSEKTARSREAVAPYINVKAPLPKVPQKANPLRFPRLRKPALSREWRMESAIWDRKQLRSSIDATKHFWQHPEHAPARCNPCEESAIVQANRMKRLI